MAKLDADDTTTYTTTSSGDVDIVYTTKQETTPEQSKAIETVIETHDSNFSRGLVEDKLRKPPNPTGKGGFGERPQDINRAGGPPKEWTFKQLLREVGDEFKEWTGKDGQIHREQHKAIATKRLWHEAMNGNIGAMREIMNRIDGMPEQSTDVTSGGDKLNPIQVLIVEDKKNEQE